MAKALAIVLLAGLYGCDGVGPQSDTLDARPPIHFEPSPHDLVDCGSDWSLPLDHPRCERACEHRVVAEPVTCGASRISSAETGSQTLYVNCLDTFELDTPHGVQTGCCALYTPITVPQVPTILAFMPCE